MQTAHLAIDLGASSGRAIIGILGGSPALLELHEVHRFEHLSLPAPTGPIWNLTDIWRNILEGIAHGCDYCRSESLELSSVGVDCWGVDWALLGKSGELLALPHCYRDPQNNDACTAALDRLGGFENVYRRTGIQKMSINTLFQVYARYQAEPELFSAASHFVFLPDLFHFWLTGNIKVEQTIASTSSMLDIATGDWDFDLIGDLNIPTHLFGEIVQPGTMIGHLLPEVAENTKAPDSLKVVTPAAHDTASAIAAIPVAQKSDWAYISSGTWSLLGVESSQPNNSDEARSVPLTNERGIENTIRLLKNISGLWLVQELRREFNRNEENEYDFEQLMRAAEMAEPFRTLIDVEREEFLLPGDMAEKIRAFAECTDQPIPETVGDLVRCCIESLALCYRSTLQKFQSITETEFDTIHIVGGGSLNILLSQMTADATNCNVVCGPVEATAIGNLLVQAMGCGELDSLSNLRKVVADSFEPTLLTPNENRNEWKKAFERYGAFFDTATA